MIGGGYNLRSAVISDRSHIANLIYFGAHVHQHLDWKPPLEWIGRKPYCLLEEKGVLEGALACPPDLPEITWLRLFAVKSNMQVQEAWDLLWSAAQDEISQSGNFIVAALSLQTWLNELLEKSKFEHTDDVVVLMWESHHTLPPPISVGISIRPMLPEDLAKVAEIDNSAFDREWRNSLEAIELAYQQSSLASVAEAAEEIVGYQYSTSSTMGGHLARLAVSPSMQNQGIGYLLVHDVLSQFTRFGTRHVTVNTQHNNRASLALYERAGFYITGESYRVYQYSTAI